MTAIFHPSTKLIFETVSADKHRFTGFLKQVQQSEAFIFDLSQVEDCDSAGLALLIEAKKLSVQQQSSCQFKGFSPEVLSCIQFFGIGETLGV